MVSIVHQTFLVIDDIIATFFYFYQMFNLNILGLSLFTSLGCQIGDLFFSFLKRKAKIKDTGKILPGHGGLLDRIDGMIFVFPICYLITIL